MDTKFVQSSFTDDHEQLDQLLASFRKLKGSDFDRAKPLFEQFSAGLRLHILREERVLFPLFEEKTGMRDHGPTVVMRAEHQEIIRRLDAIHDKVRSRDTSSDQDEEALVEILAAHNFKEENILYPAIDRSLNAEEKAAAFERMEALAAETGQDHAQANRSGEPEVLGHTGSVRYSPNYFVAHH